MSLIVIEAAKE